MNRTAFRLFSAIIGAAASLGLSAAPLAAQVQTVDPDSAYNAPIDGDLEQPAPAQEAAQPVPVPVPASAGEIAPVSAPTGETAAAASVETAAQKGDTTQTYREEDLVGAAEGLFGKGAKGVADMIRKTLKDQGQPNGYIVGREAGGAFIVGLRYGSGTLHHKVEGQQPVYWTGPSIGFDAGASAGSTFVLVYNLYDTEELYKRFPAGEGQAYAVGGLNASYLRWGDVVLIPIRVGAGLRLGVNAGYMKFSKKQNWLPF